jgi:hypothetical protein
VGRRVLIGTIVAIFGIAGALGTGYSAGAKLGSGHGTQKLARALRACKKNRSKSKRRKCERTAEAKYESKTKTGDHKGTGTGTTTGIGTTETATGTVATEPPEDLSATVIVHVNVVVAGCREPGGPDETAPIRITRLPASGLIHSIETSEHTVHLVPGNYEIRATIPNAGGTPRAPQDVMLSAGQTQEVTLEIRRECYVPF